MTYARILILLLIVVMKVFSGINNQGEASSGSAGGRQLPYTVPLTAPSHTEMLVETLQDTLYLAEMPALVSDEKR